MDPSRKFLTSRKDHKINMIIWSLILILLSIGTLGVRPPECDLNVENPTGSSTEGFSASCNVRTLTSALFDAKSDNNFSLSVLKHSSDVTSLTVKCAHQVVFQSEVISGMFASFPRLEDLTLVSCKIISLPDYFLSGLPNLRRVSIRAHHEYWPGASLQIKPFALSDLPRLEVLNLSFNNLWNVPSGSICHLPSLATLNLTHNSLHDLDDFKLGSNGGCSHPLMHLHLDYNELSEIPDKMLENAGDLRIISLRSNGLSHLGDFAFKGLYELKRLDLSENSLVALPQTLFEDLRQLRDLNVCNNSLSGLPPGLFKHSKHLLTLNLQENQLVFTSSNTQPFKGLIRLIILDLSRNKLSFIGSNTFKDLYSLQVLYLSHNEINFLDDNTFSDLANLHTLQLSDNKLTILTSNVFAGLSVLSSLTLDSNNLFDIHSKSLKNCTSLQQLDLSKNAFTQIPKALSRTIRLKTLNLEANEINTISGSSLEGLSNLEELNLSHNKIKNLTAYSFKDQKNLKFLDVSNNYISEVQNGTLNTILYLSGFNISHNRFKSLYGVVMSLHNLTWLNASHNQLEWFDYAVVPPNLIWIDISHNNLQKLGNYYKLEDQIKLKYIYASHNNISEINPHSIPNKIEQIFLQNNKIDFIASNSLIDKVALTMINLSHNRLSLIGDSSIRLPTRTFGSGKLFPVLYLTGNHLECDCNAEWLLKSIHEGHKQIPMGGSVLPQLGDFANVKCKLPGIWNHTNVPAVTVSDNQFLCTYQRHCFPVCHCCEFDACDCEQTCPRNCTCYHDHSWAHNIVDCSKGGWSVMPSGVPMDVSEAYMDGNNIGALTSHSLIGRKNLKVLYLNSSQITTIQNKTFNGLRNLLILRLSGNLIKTLDGFEFNHLQNLKQLYLDYNVLSYVKNTTFSHLTNLEVLRLDHNRLAFFPVWNFALNPFIVEVTLNDNPWSCECSFLANMRSWLEANRIKTLNGATVACFHNQTKEQGPPILSESPIRCDHYLASSNINSLIAHDYVMLITISISLVLLFICSTFIAVVYRRRLKFWATSRYGKRFFNKSVDGEEKEKLFDGFISHSIKDSAWVCGLLAPELEAQGFHLCVAHRDCSLPSSPINSQSIIESINCSRRVIMVLSKSFIDGEWCKYDFKSAHMEALRKIKRKHLIIIILEDVSRSEFDTELNAIIRSNSSALNPRDPRFWERLKRSLPSLRSKKRHQNKNDLNKTASYPLVATELSTCSPAWHSSTNKGVPVAPSPTLTINPYWETAVVTSNIQNGNGNWVQPSSSNATKSTWVSSLHCSPIVSCQESGARDSEHTYMSMSELGETPSTILAESKTMSFRESHASNPHMVSKASGNGSAKHFQSHTMGNNQLFKRNAPDYLTRSWIFHHTPDQNQPIPGQTYFV